MKFKNVLDVTTHAGYFNYYSCLKRLADKLPASVRSFIFRNFVFAPRWRNAMLKTGDIVEFSATLDPEKPMQNYYGFIFSEDMPDPWWESFGKTADEENYARACWCSWQMQQGLTQQPCITMTGGKYCGVSLYVQITESSYVIFAASAVVRILGRARDWEERRQATANLMPSLKDNSVVDPVSSV